MTPRRCVFVVLLLFGAFIVSANTEIVQPRSFGYVLGDVLEQRIQLPGRITSPLSRDLEQVERVNNWLERISAEVSTDSDAQHWLILRYQITNAVAQSTIISLPALDIMLADGGHLNVESWPVAISPLTPEDGADSLPSLHPDRAAIASISNQAAERLRSLLAALLLCLLGWFGWWKWRQSRDAVRLPFASAQRKFKRLPADNLDDNAQAWLILHHAINASAGRSIQARNVDLLFTKHPWLASLQTQIEAFYEASCARFFAQSKSAPGFALKQFCDDLYRAEKRHSSGRP